VISGSFPEDARYAGSNSQLETKLYKGLRFHFESQVADKIRSGAVILSAVALVAVGLPATRASRLDPQQALRIE
jgi:hypothetical protein